MPPAEPGDWNVNGPIGKYDSTRAANQHHTDLGIGTGLRPLTMLHRIRDKCSSRWRTSDHYSNHLNPQFSKTDYAETCGRPPSVEELYSLQNDDLESTLCSI